MTKKIYPSYGCENFCRVNLECGAVSGVIGSSETFKNQVRKYASPETHDKWTKSSLRNNMGTRDQNN
jgi:hypothetical protein